MSSGEPDLARFANRRHFATTRWSVVLAAGESSGPDARQALAELCETYWYPLYAYVRRRVSGIHEAQDLTQAFFAHLLEKDTLAHAQPERGRFRAFLLTALKNYLANQWNQARAQKRGGGNSTLSLDFNWGEERYGIEPSHDVTPEKLYERRWVMTLLDQVLQRLQDELAADGKERYFEEFKCALTGEATSADYNSAAQALGITSAAAKQAAYRLRKRYRELLRAEVARTVDSDEGVDEEIRRLFESLG